MIDYPLDQDFGVLADLHPYGPMSTWFTKNRCIKRLADSSIQELENLFVYIEKRMISITSTHTNLGDDLTSAAVETTLAFFRQWSQIIDKLLKSRLEQK